MREEDKVMKDVPFCDGLFGGRNSRALGVTATYNTLYLPIEMMAMMKLEQMLEICQLG